MDKRNTNIPLEILFLNDLLRVNAIDQNIYDLAQSKLLSITEKKRDTAPSSVKATV